MTTVLARFQVADYDAFRPGYDTAVAAFGEIRSHRVWRGQDDPNLVMVEETFDTREEAQMVWTDAEMQAAMEADGVDMASVWIEYFDEVDSGTNWA